MGLFDRFQEMADEHRARGKTEDTTSEKDEWLIDTWLRVPLSSPQVPEFKQQLMIRNPDYLNAVRMGHKTNGIKEWVEMYKEDSTHLLVPRGLATRYMNNPNFMMIDHTTLGDKEVDFKSRIQLRENQISFVNQLLHASSETYGTLGMAQPGFGS